MTHRTLTKRASTVVLGALLACLVAAPSASARTYYACVAKKGGALRIVGKTTKCKKNREKKISFNSEGVAGTNGLNGAGGKDGAPGTTGFTSTLPVGKSEFGTWAADLFVESANYYIPLSFNIPLAARPEVEIVGPKAPSTQACPGTPARPQAASGHLCIYVATLFQGTLSVFDPSEAGGAEGADVSGTVLLLSNGPNKEAYGYGTWAVTG